MSTATWLGRWWWAFTPSPLIARQADLHVGDVVVGLNDKGVANVDDVHRALQSGPP